ncbi:hypothetical protein BD289DRAFT_280549 [Coniella lustricola]|uniref:Uncharacterized protein n=1 Tax=Coniella lustricola TaxID=2025994 RepID=A0A2T3A648_9PEZI|nr:hypothetical protein BD289DRAFT_280549 [Coniella lustricola]
MHRRIQLGQLIYYVCAALSYIRDGYLSRTCTWGAWSCGRDERTRALAAAWTNLGFRPSAASPVYLGHNCRVPQSTPPKPFLLLVLYTQNCPPGVYLACIWSLMRSLSGLVLSEQDIQVLCDKSGNAGLVRRGKRGIWVPRYLGYLLHIE